ncbi:hypothetical protein ACJJTC_018341 [Scirpophaga incertulas]
MSFKILTLRFGGVKLPHRKETFSPLILAAVEPHKGVCHLDVLCKPLVSESGSRPLLRREEPADMKIRRGAAVPTRGTEEGVREGSIWVTPGVTPTINSRAGARRLPSHSTRRRLPNASRILARQH